MGSATAEALHLRSFLQESKIATQVNVVIHTDNSTTRSIATRHGTRKATRHIQLRYLFVQDLVTSGVIQIKKIPGTTNLADILTEFVRA